MDADGRVRADSGTIEYYLNRLIQRAIVEPKPLLKIYEEECQRHSDISVTVTFKEFQAALQKHCMTLQSRHQHIPVAALQARLHEVNNYPSKEQNAKYAAAALSHYVDQAKKRRRSDPHPSQVYHRVPHSVLERFSPQASHVNYRNSAQQHASVPMHPVKTEERSYTSPPAIQHPPHTISRPPSVHLPIEEESPPEFIEMSSNPPRLSVSSPFSNMNIYQNQVSCEQNVTPTPGSVACKGEPKEPNSSGSSIGAVQSSSPMDKHANLSSVENLSPLNVRCVKCITALVTCAVMPCGHCCLCSICGQTVLSLKQVCPVCRKSISTVVGYSNIIYNVYR